MEFRTPISIPKSKHAIGYDSKIFSIGSCFAENMAKKLEFFKFQNNTNPFGIIFNPVSIENVIDRIVNQKLFTENDIFFYNERWHCFEVHSDVSHPDKDIFLGTLNKIVTDLHPLFTNFSHYYITYGTSWVYRNIPKGFIVANCHKVPQNQFVKEILSTEGIQKSIQKTIELIHSVNPKGMIVFTVSPVRHLKDGFVENQRSKAHLISAIHNLLENEDLRDNAEYFPSYEIVMDELRDYRFYAEDMLHPNQIAIDYIWEKFKMSSISEASYLIMNEVESIQRGMAHRPFNEQSESHKQFKSKLLEKTLSLTEKYPFMRF